MSPIAWRISFKRQQQTVVVLSRISIGSGRHQHTLRQEENRQDAAVVAVSFGYNR